MFKIPFNRIQRCTQICLLGLAVSACGKSGVGPLNPFQRGDLNDEAEAQVLELSENGKLKVQVLPQAEPHAYNARIEWSLGENVDAEGLTIERWEADHVQSIDISGQVSGMIEDVGVGDGKTLSYRLVQGIDSRRLEFARNEVRVPKDLLVSGLLLRRNLEVPKDGFGRVFMSKGALIKTGSLDFQLKTEVLLVEQEASILSFESTDVARKGESGASGGNIKLQIGRLDSWKNNTLPKLHVIASGQKGGEGMVGVKGAKGTRGSAGRDSEVVETRNAFKCSGGSVGEQGARGGDGGRGGRGMKGGDAGLLSVDLVETKSGNLEVASVGGEGGDGGFGGEGGEGGDGGSGGMGCGNRKFPDGPRGESGNRGPQGERGASGLKQAIILNGQSFR